MTRIRLHNLPIPLKVAFVGLIVGLIFTWLANLFMFSESRIHAGAYPILARDYKSITYDIGTMPLSLAQIVLLGIGVCLVMASFAVFLYYAKEKETKKDICGFILGTCLLLLALPILQLWTPMSNKSVQPPSGPIAINLILSIAGAIIVIVYIFKTELFLRHSIIPAKTRVAMFIVMSMGVLSGSFFFTLGASAYIHFGTFYFGRSMMILSPILCLIAFIIGAISYARDRGQLLEMENNREVRKCRKLRKLEEQAQMEFNTIVTHTV